MVKVKLNNGNIISRYPIDAAEIVNKGFGIYFEQTNNPVVDTEEKIENSEFEIPEPIKPETKIENKPLVTAKPRRGRKKAI